VNGAQEAARGAVRVASELAEQLRHVEQERELFRAAWLNANGSIGRLNATIAARRMALDESEAERLRLAAAAARWERRWHSMRRWAVCYRITAALLAAALTLAVLR